MNFGKINRAIVESLNEGLIDEDDAVWLQARMAERQREAVTAGYDDHRIDLDEVCPICRPLGCDNPDQHLGVPSRYTPLKNRGCHCGADFDGRDCMCFEDYS